MKQNFEQIIRNSVNNHEVPYEEGAWEKFQSNLPSSTPFYKSNWFIASGIALLITAGVIGYSLTNNEIVTKNTLDSAPIAQNTEAENTNKPSQAKEQSIKNESTKENISLDENNKEEVTTSVTRNENSNTNPQETQSTSPVSNSDNSNTKPSDEIQSVTPPINPIKNETPTVTETEMVSADFYLEKKVCKGNKVYLIADKVNPSYKYIWSIDGNKILEGNSVTYKPTESGIHSITLTVKSKGKVVATKTSSLSVIDLPEIETTIKNDEFSVKNDFSFEINPHANTTVKWNLGDGTTTSEASVNHTYKKGGVYTTTCTITNEEGCAATVTEKVEVKGLYNIRTDYGFSPNGDNINDAFLPVELNTLNVPFTMNVYSRNGQLVFTTNSIQRPWNGLMQDGSKCPFGSYVWVVTLTNEYGNQEVYKGTITNVTN